MKLLLVGVAILVAGCTTTEAELAESTHELGPVGWDGMQGSPLLGPYADTLGSSTAHYRVTTTAIKGSEIGSASVVDGHLVITAPSGTYSGADPGIVDWKLFGSGSSLTIKSADVSPTNPSVTVYGLWYDAASRWYCGTSSVKAVPFKGAWQRDGLHVDSASSISFGCTDAAAFKCVNWGYVPNTAVSLSLNGTAWDYHQACTRMARADYCSNGTPHTRNGTMIDMFDDVPTTAQPPPVNDWPDLTPWPPAVGDYYFEAAWRGGSATPVCLSRLRWQSMPVGGCSTLIDPRKNPDDGKYCEQLTVNQMSTQGALTYNRSPFNDLGMHRWHNVAGTDQVTTVRGYVGASYAFSGVTEDGGLDGILVRSLPASISASEVVEVHAYTSSTGDHVVTTGATAPANYVKEPEFEGYIFVREREDTTPFYLDSNGSDYMTTTASSPDAGYTRRATLGHVWN